MVLLDAKQAAETSNVIVRFCTIVINEDIPSKDDERDHLIELKSTRISHWIFITGFLFAMGSLAFGCQPKVMFIVLFASGFVSSIISESVKLYYYRRGI